MRRRRCYWGEKEENPSILKCRWQTCLATPTLVMMWAAGAPDDRAVNHGTLLRASHEVHGHPAVERLNIKGTLNKTDCHGLKLLRKLARVPTFPLAVPPETPMRNGCRMMLVFSSRSLRCVSLSPAILAVCGPDRWAGGSLCRRPLPSTTRYVILSVKNIVIYTFYIYRITWIHKYKRGHILQ